MAGYAGNKSSFVQVDHGGKWIPLGQWANNVAAYLPAEPDAELAAEEGRRIMTQHVARGVSHGWPSPGWVAMMHPVLHVLVCGHIRLATSSDVVRGCKLLACL